MPETPDTTLWAVHVLGPDDIHAAADHADALALCDELNALGLQFNAGHRPGDLGYVIHIAYPLPWPASPGAHAECLALRKKEEAEWFARREKFLVAQASTTPEIPDKSAAAAIGALIDREPNNG